MAEHIDWDSVLAKVKLEDDAVGEIKPVLKPCPFCGGEATPVYCENGSSYTSNILYVSKKGTVKCKRCELRLPRVYKRVSKAIEAWNRRAGESDG